MNVSTYVATYISLDSLVGFASIAESKSSPYQFISLLSRFIVERREAKK